MGYKFQSSREGIRIIFPDNSEQIVDELGKVSLAGGIFTIVRDTTIIASFTQTEIESIGGQKPEKHDHGVLGQLNSLLDSLGDTRGIEGKLIQAVDFLASIDQTLKNRTIIDGNGN